MKKPRLIAFVTFAAVLAAAVLGLGFWIGQATRARGMHGAKMGYASKRPTRPMAPSQSGPDAVANFVLLDQHGESHELYYNSTAKAIVLITHGNDCPIVQKSARFIKEIARKFGPAGVEFLMLNANLQDTRESISKEAIEFGIDIPILIDVGQVVTRMLGSERTAEAIVIDPKTWTIVYRGAIDDRFQLGAEKPDSKERYLEDALSAIVAGHPIHVARTSPKGCLITFKKLADVDFVHDVAPIMIDKCLNCHRSNQRIRPFFDRYETVAGWTAMIRETLLTRRMPPWGLDTEGAEFANDGALSVDELTTLHRWIDLGAPRGDGEDPIKNLPVKAAEEKDELGKPILATDIGVDQVVPPEGFFEYKYYQIAGPLPSDLTIAAIRTTPSIPQQIHHIALLATEDPLSSYVNAAAEKEDEEKIKSKEDGAIPMWTLMEIRRHDKKFDYHLQTQVFAAGRKQPHKRPPHRRAMFFPKGSYLIAQVHYNGSGKKEIDRTKFEFFEYNKKEKPFILRTASIKEVEFAIPPNTEKYVVKKAVTLKRSIRMVSINPHMHMRGKALSLEATFPDGRTETVFSIPNYYYGWHVGASLNFRIPKLFPAGTKLEMIAVFDNSAKNPYNPDPTKTVYFGQTVDKTEMPKVNYTYVVVDGERPGGRPKPITKK